MDRFELLKYTILLEETMKKEVIQLLNFVGGDASKIFDLNFQLWKDNAIYVSNKNSARQAIWKCSHGEFNNIFRALKTLYSSRLYESTILKGLSTKKRDLNKLLSANKILRNTLAHPLDDLKTALNKIQNFNSFGRETAYENIVYFYTFFKDSLDNQH